VAAVVDEMVGVGGEVESDRFADLNGGWWVDEDGVWWEGGEEMVGGGGGCLETERKVEEEIIKNAPHFYL